MNINKEQIKLLSLFEAGETPFVWKHKTKDIKVVHLSVARDDNYNGSQIIKNGVVVDTLKGDYLPECFIKAIKRAIK